MLYREGDHVLFRREPGRLWEAGTYIAADMTPGANGKWHRVRDARGFGEVHYVPNRRIKQGTVVESIHCTPPRETYFEPIQAEDVKKSS
jgi:hypothetical protein